MEAVGDSMIPILFDGNATQFTSNGIGALKDCLSCEVTEERNGIYELVMVYPTNGIHFTEITTMKIVVVKPNQAQEKQAFRIYKITKPINQKVTIYANHISYGQSYVPIQPFTATGITNTIQGFYNNALESNNYTFTTDLTNEVSTFNLTQSVSLRKCLGGMEGSILDTFSGSSGVEYLWDNFNTFITLHRGTDNGVQLRYRKNITDLEQSESAEDIVTGVLPVWNSAEGDISIKGNIQYSQYADAYPIHLTEVLDLSSEFDTMPTVDELNQAAQRYITRDSVGLPKINIKLSFVDLSQIDVTPKPLLETVNLCDTIHVIYAPLDIKFDAKVVKTTWDVLRNRYISIEIGNPKSTISQTIADNIGDISSLKLSNNKLVSVTQSIDREVGEVTTTVASVEAKANVNETNISQLQINLDGIQTQVTNTQTNLSNSVSMLSTSIQQTADDITLTISDVQSTVTSQGEQITELETYIKATNRGLEIGKNTDNVVAVYGSSELGFFDRQDRKLAWLSTNEGLGASALSVGDANNQANRWRVITRQGGSHLTITRHT